MRLAALAPLLLTPLLLSGCSASEEGPSDDRPAASTDSSAAAPTSVPTSGAAAGAQQPCDLLEPADYRRYITPGFRRAAYESEGLDRQSGGFRVCYVTSGLVTLLTFGYSVQPDGWEVVQANTQPGKVVTPEGFEEVGKAFARKRFDVPAGDEAFLVRTIDDLQGYVRLDDVALVFDPAGLALPSDVTGADFAATMLAMSTNAQEGLDLTPVDLPEACPAADAESVTDLIGEVRYAYGAEFTGIPASCHYLGDSGTRLSAGGSALPAATFESELRSEALDTDVLVDEPTRRVEHYDDPEDDGHTAFGFYPSERVTFQVDTSATLWGPPEVAGTRASFLRFVDAYRAVADPTVLGP